MNQKASSRYLYRYIYNENQPNNSQMNLRKTFKSIYKKEK